MLTNSEMRAWLRARGWEVRDKRPRKGMIKSPCGGYWTTGRLGLRDAVDWQLADDDRRRRMGVGK